MEHGAIEVLAGMLKPEHNIKINDLQIVLEGIEGILSIYGTAGSVNPYAEQFEELEGLDNLERIQADENLSEEVYDSIIKLMRRYYGTEDEIIYNDAAEGELLNAKMDHKNGHFVFGIGSNINNMNNNNNKNFGGNSK